LKDFGEITNENLNDLSITLQQLELPGLVHYNSFS